MAVIVALSIGVVAVICRIIFWSFDLTWQPKYAIGFYLMSLAWQILKAQTKTN